MPHAITAPATAVTIAADFRPHAVNPVPFSCVPEDGSVWPATARNQVMGGQP